MPPMLVVKKRMSAIKQHGKGDNVHQKPLNITQFLKNSNLRNFIKSIFDSDLHHGLIKVWVEEGPDTKRDGFITSRG